MTTGEATEWTFTKPVEGNPWRARARGHRVLAFPVWLYCNDTSGNLSKKWNEHNSVLMTPAGLPQEYSQKEYNIHFLSTSNIVPPLEMMDGVVEQLEYVLFNYSLFLYLNLRRRAQTDGIWAWDCQYNEAVLVIPFVLALLGDNPMQSEFACHMGLQAKLFCRSCWCKGQDAVGDPDEFVGTGDAGTDEAGSQRSDGSEAAGMAVEDTGSVDAVSSREGSAGPREPKKKGRAKRALESMSDMVSRVTAFVKVSAYCDFELSYADTAHLGL